MATSGAIDRSDSPRSQLADVIKRYPDLLDICCAISGRFPAVGLHLTENRAGEVLMHLLDVPPALQTNDCFYPVLGHLVDKIAQDRIPVIDGLAAQLSEDQLKALSAAASSSGAVALLHLVGVTPEAPTLEAALQCRAPKIPTSNPQPRPARPLRPLGLCG